MKIHTKLIYTTLVCKQSKNAPLKHKNIHTKLKLFRLVCIQNKKSRKLRKIYIPKCIFSIWYVKTKKNVAIQCTYQNALKKIVDIYLTTIKKN